MFNILSSPSFALRFFYFFLIILVSAACKMDETAVLAPIALETNTPIPTLSPAVSATPLPTTISPTVEPTLTAVPSPTETAEPLPTMRPMAQPIAARRSHYHLKTTLDYAAREVFVEQVLHYVNTSNRPLTRLLLIVEPNRQEGVFSLNRFEGGGGDHHELVDGQLWVTLSEPLNPQAVVTLTLEYTLMIPDLAEPLGYNGRQINLGDWYPFVPPYDTERGWLVHEPSNVGEHLVYDTADFTVELVTIGALIDLDVAASGAVTEQEEGRWLFHLEEGRNFAMSVSSDFEIGTEAVRGVQVTSYYFAENRQAGQDALSTAVDALLIYSDLFGPYPHESLTVVAANLSDGQEFSGLVFVDQDLYSGYNGQASSYLVAITAHEVAHQWWYGIVGNDQAAEPWLDEALATYSELLFYEALQPEVVDWWWAVRVERFESETAVDSTIYDRFDFERYVSAVYLRGAKFLHALRGELGTEAFIAILRLYRTEHDGGIATKESFFDLVGSYTERDLSELEARYFEP